MRAVTVVGGALGVVVAAHTAFGAPAEAYGRLPAIFDAAISPDGTKIAIAETSTEGLEALRILDVETGKPVYGARVGGARDTRQQANLRGVGWADDAHAIYLISATLPTGQTTPSYVLTPGRSRIDYWRVGIVDLASQHIYYATTNKDQEWGLSNLANLVSPIDGDRGFGRLQARTGPFRDDVVAVYRIDLKNGRGRMTYRGNSDTLRFVLDGHGDPIVRIDSNERTNRWSVFATDDGQNREILSQSSETGIPIDIAGVLPDGRLAVLDRLGNSDKVGLYAMDKTSGQIKPLYTEADRDIDSVIEDPWSHEVVGVSWQRDLTLQYFLSPDLGSAYKEAKTLAPKGVAKLLQWSRDRKRFIVYIEHASDAGGFYLYDRAAHTIKMIALRYPDLRATDLGDRQAITYPARDGTRIPAYLTLPTGSPRKNLPLVVLVHGGPTARDNFEFDWWASFLASRGYAVVQPNFRGSGGYGAEWETSGYRQWGALMQTDVEDAAAALARGGIADASRVCIVGASYGGYAALAGAALTPDRYICAASIAGVADLPMMLSNVAAASGARSITSDWWRMLIGDRREEKDRLREISPVYRAADVRAPILLIHGANDTVVPIAQSQRMADALHDTGKDVRLVEFPGEDHWLSDAETRIAMLKELETFLAAHLKP